MTTRKIRVPVSAGPMLIDDGVLQGLDVEFVRDTDDTKQPHHGGTKGNPNVEVGPGGHHTVRNDGLKEG